jgi:hypothetical protein
MGPIPGAATEAPHVASAGVVVSRRLHTESIMHLGELHERYSEFVKAVVSRIEDGRQDPNAVLDSKPAQFTLRAVTVPGESPTYMSRNMRERLQSSASIETLADEFMTRWQEQKLIDQAV